MSLSNSIPVEICYAILDELTAQHSWSIDTRRYIVSASQVSHTFRSYLLPRIFRDAPCYSSQCVGTLHDLLVANPRLATCIKSFSLIRGGKGSKWSRDVNWVAKDVALPLVVPLLSRSIENLTLETSLECGHLAWACIRAHVKSALRTLLSSPSLKSLSIKYFQVSCDLLEHISSSIEHLTLEGVQLATATSHADITSRLPSRLRTLTVWHTPLAFDVLLSSFQEHGFPQLETVEVKDRGWLEGDLRAVMRLIPISPKLQVVKTTTKNYFRRSPSQIKSTASLSPFTSLLIACPYEPSFMSTLKSLTHWLSLSLEMDSPPPPHLPSTPPPPASPSIPSSIPSHLAPNASAVGITTPSPAFSLPPRSMLKHLKIEFDSTNAHLSRGDTASRLCGQIGDVKQNLRVLKEWVDHPGYASVEDVILDFSSFGLTEKQEISVRKAVMEGLEDKAEGEDTPNLRGSKFSLIF